MSDNEIDAVTAVLKNEYLGMGSNVCEFEAALKQYLNSDMEVVCVNSGTAALHLTLLCLGIGKGDEVLVPSLTYVATFQAISATGATPIACEVDPDTLFLDVTDAEKKISDKTKAVLPVHYASSSKGIDGVYDLANRYSLRVVEDGAQSFGSLNKGVKVGCVGDIICFSFDGIKNITAGEGGAIVTSDISLVEKLKDSRLLGVKKDTESRYKGQRSWDFDVDFQGLRYHMSNINAAIGIEQLKRISFFKERRQQIVFHYLNELQSIPEVTFLDFEYEEVMPHIFVVLAEQRDDLRVFMLESGIECGIHYKPNHLLKLYRTDYELPLTETLYSKIITLPCHVDLDERDISFICQKLKEFYEK